MNRPPLLFLAFLAWCGLSYFTPASVYWRDSGEFIISAFYLDVAHPAGFPLYSTMANLFALFPVGPIAWRVNSFSTATAIANLILCFYLSFLIAQRIFSCTKAASSILALGSTVVLIGCQAFLRQALVSEVYLLSACLVQILLVCYLHYRLDQDRRYILVASFVGGLALGNHVSIALFLFAACIILLSEWSGLRRLMPATILLGMAGMMIYLYIPVRASSAPPLNTGSATSMSRFMDLVTDERDRALRPETAPSEASLSYFLSLERTQKLFYKDLRRIQEHIPTLVLVLALIGLLVLIAQETRFGILVCSAGLTNWYFFKGWDPDPWIPIFLVIALGVSVLGALLISRLPQENSSMQSACAACLFLISGLFSLGDFSSVDSRELSIRDFHLPAQVGQLVLAGAPPGTPLVVEPSWFLTKYMRDIEGFREETPLIFLPQLTAPRYFRPTELISEGGDNFSSQSAIDDDRDSSLRGLEQLSGFTAKISPIIYEPNQALNAPLWRFAQLEPTGLASLTSGEMGSYDPQFFEGHKNFIRLIRGVVGSGSTALQKDSMNYLEAVETAVADALSQVGKTEEAVKLLRLTCAPLSETPCSLVSINNLGVYLMENDQFDQAVDVLLRGISGKPHVPQVVYKNIQDALSELDAATVQQLKERYGAQLPQHLIPKHLQSEAVQG